MKISAILSRSPGALREGLDEGFSAVRTWGEDWPEGVDGDAGVMPTAPELDDECNCLVEAVTVDRERADDYQHSSLPSLSFNHARVRSPQ